MRAYSEVICSVFSEAYFQVNRIAVVFLFVLLFIFNTVLQLIFLSLQNIDYYT